MGSANSVLKLHFPKNFTECLDQYIEFNTTENTCPAFWDGVLCWPPTLFGHLVTNQCPVFEDGRIVGETNNPDLFAFRACDVNGQWADNYTNYDKCIESMSDLYFHRPVSYQMCYIVVIFSVLSLIVLIISLFIFFHFKSLQCCRLRVHRNLCLALILYLTFLLPSSVAILLHLNFMEQPWLCKICLALHLFSQMAAVAWMFVEGLLLHSRVTIDIFGQKAPFKLYYCIGWGLPVLLTTLWLSLMVYNESDDHCWSDFGSKDFVWLLTGPMLVALVVNALFLVNIIRILVTKRQAHNATESVQVRKALKATVFLFPLLGISHLVFVVNPGGGQGAETAYWIFNSFIRTSQGLFFGMIYCFMNTDVQTCVRNAYLRSAIRRDPARFPLRSMRCVSQTSNTYVSAAADPLDKMKIEHRKELKVYQSPGRTTDEGLTML